MRNGSPPEDRQARPRGRPRVAEPLEESVTARLPVTQYRQLQDLADRRDMPVSTLVRQLLIFRLR